MNDIFKLALIPGDVEVTFYTVGGVEVKGYVNLIDDATGNVQLNSEPPLSKRNGQKIIRLRAGHVTHWFTIEPR